MHSVLHGSLSRDTIVSDVGEIDGIEILLTHIHESRLIKRNKALCVLADAKGIPKITIYNFLGIDRTTCRKYIKVYKSNGVAALYSRKRTLVRKKDNEEIKKVVFATLHEPPSDHDINRTTWKRDDLIQVLSQKGVVIGKDCLRQITKESGFKWRNARIVLTSNDPDYREKLDFVQEALRNLRTDEAFFSIDEFGPFAVKMKGGRKLVGPEEKFTVPQWQKSKGCLIMTAALELSTNQVTHFYSKKKNTDEMIRMLNLLIERYRGFRKIWLSWDAASWHMSKKLFEHIEATNVMAYITGTPIVETAPLPAGAQFLNVIESVFSGLARSVIHNSNYNSVDEAKAAIDRYFEERNEHFELNPKRAGKKIWGEERVVSQFNEANNCKDPRYR
jgi:transposase